MQKIVIIFLVQLFFLLSSFVYGAEMNILTFNLHCFENQWQKRLKILAKEIAKSDYDIISLQEVCRDKENDAMEFLFLELKKNGYLIKSFEKKFAHMAWDKYQEFLLMFSKHDALKAESGDLPESPMHRVYVSMTLNDVEFVNVHLEYSEEWQQYRKNQIDFLAKKYRAKKAIIMGDFNTLKQSKESEGFADNNFTSFFAGNTYPAIAPEIEIDGFWASEEFMKNYQLKDPQLEFKKTYSKEELYLSDHFGVSISYQ